MSFLFDFTIDFILAVAFWPDPVF